MKLLVIAFVVNFVFSDESGIYHEPSKITFRPDKASGYFGYSIVLSKSGLIVGAPKARSRTHENVSPGLVFICPINFDSNNHTCIPVTMNDDDLFRYKAPSMGDDMWFGATMAVLPGNKLLVCAPRRISLYIQRKNDEHFLMNGACYLHISPSRGRILFPLGDPDRQGFRNRGDRKAYREFGNSSNFYAYGQAGMAVKVSQDNDVIIGAPGLMQWTGGIVIYKYYPKSADASLGRQTPNNPYFTLDLSPDDYFGYSVESGLFQPKSKKHLYVAGAPRSKIGYGQVIIFEPALREQAPLNIHAKIMGPQIGSYFGASLCCTDINGDGRTDLLVGAPNFVKKDIGLPYDQGAVFVYLSREEESGFTLESAGYVSGSERNGARFGTTIAELGDVDRDGFVDIAIGAPWEDGGVGVVYIYKGCAEGLRTEYAQRIKASGASGFGFSIAKGVDFDNNKCNDLAIGAFNSETSYLYRCMPTMQVHASIKVPDALDLPQNATNFTASFCVTAPSVVVSGKSLWSHVKIQLKATIIVDPVNKRATLTGDSEYFMTISPGSNKCDEQVIEFEPTADLSKPITIKFQLETAEPLTDLFPKDTARLSEDSKLHSTLDIQLTRDCGEDLICKPWLQMFLEPFNSTYVPGTDDKLGVIITVLNTEEPAYDVKVTLYLPSPPKRLPSSCTLDNLNVSCRVAAPLHRNESIIWDIELEYIFNNTVKKNLKITGVIEDELYRNISDGKPKVASIMVQPEAYFSVSGKSLNVSLPVTREKLDQGEIMQFTHYLEVTNLGPSDWSNLTVEILLSEMVTLSKSIMGCKEQDHKLSCAWSLPAKVSLPTILQLQYDLKKHSKILQEFPTVNVTSRMILVEQNKTINVTTSLILDPEQPLWPIVVGVLAGVLIQVIVVYALRKYGFFSRRRRDDLKRLLDESSAAANAPTGSGHESTTDLDQPTKNLIDEESESD